MLQSSDFLPKYLLSFILYINLTKIDGATMLNEMPIIFVINYTNNKNSQHKLLETL